MIQLTIIILIGLLLTPVSNSINISRFFDKNDNNLFDDVIDNSFQGTIYEVPGIRECTWYQSDAYNDDLEDFLDNNGFTHNADDVPLGCTSVALGMVMRAHEWPTRGRGIVENDDILRGTTYHHRVNLGSQSYDYDAMDWDSATTETSFFLYHVAVSVGMNWGWETSYGYYGKCVLDRDCAVRYCPQDFDDEWRYRTPTATTDKDDLIDSLKWGLPVPICVGKHSAVVYAYNSGTDKFRINWGWGDRQDENDNWHSWPSGGGHFTCWSGKTCGPVYSKITHMAPEHWVFCKFHTISGSGVGTAKNPYNDIDDAIDYIKNTILDDYNRGIINLYTGHYGTSKIDVPCTIRAVNGEVTLSTSDVEMVETSGWLGLSIDLKSFGEPVPYSVVTEGMFVFSKEISGVINPNTNETIKIIPFGFGNCNIEITVDGIPQNYTCFLVGPLVLNLNKVEPK